MINLFFVRLKCLSRNKENMFWCFLFPLILATCFFFAFNNIWSTEKFETIDIAYVSEIKEGDYLKEAMQKAKMTNNTLMFNLIITDKEKAADMFSSNEIEAYVEGGIVPELHVKHNGIYETIIKSFLDNYLQTTDTIQTILANNTSVNIEELTKDLTGQKSYIVDMKGYKKPNMVMIYYYALLAYTIIFAASWGLDEVVNIQADQSQRGARINVSPVHKMKLFICNILAAFVVHIISLFILFIYMRYFIKVDFGNNLGYIIIIAIVGSLAGLSLGAAVGVWVRQRREVKDGILTAIVLIGSFLSGMMFAQMKYYVATYVPFLQYINPVNLVTDAIYSLYYYDTHERFILNTVILAFMAVLLSFISYMGLRRKSYASI